jgi:urease accessory protein
MPTEMIAQPPRARGEVHLTLRDTPRGTELQTLRQAGSLRALFPRGAARSRQVVLTNTSGGVTGGDAFRTRIEAGAKARVTVTTQAAERAYRAQPGQTGRIETRLSVGPGARIDWLPQETILFECSALQRRLSVDLAEDASALIVESLIFGRTAMGETLRSASLDDRIELTRNGAPLWLDRIRLMGDLDAELARPAVANGGRAVATLVLADPTAEARLDALRALLPETAGASLIRPGLLAARLVAEDGFALRQSLVPALNLLHDDTIPRPWML